VLPSGSTEVVIKKWWPKGLYVRTWPSRVTTVKPALFPVMLE
jgi:hypothetical protein